MKNVIVLALFMLFAVICNATASAEEKATGQNMFSSKTECEQAILSGNVRFYEPTYFGLKEKDPVNGTTRVSVPLEGNECFLMLTVQGKKWVAQKEGTEFRYVKDSDGNLAAVPYARDDCGNPVYKPYTKPLVYVPAVQAVSQNPCAPSGVYGVDQNGRPYCDYPQQEAEYSSYGWGQWLIALGIGGAIAAIGNNQHRHHRSGGAPSVITLPPGGGAPGVVTGSYRY